MLVVRAPAGNAQWVKIDDGGGSGTGIYADHLFPWETFTITLNHN